MSDMVLQPPSIAQPDDVGQPPQLVLEVAAPAEDLVALVLLLVPALEVDLGAAETRLEHRLLDLGQRPQPPVVAERASHPGAIAEAEVDVAEIGRAHV